MLDFSLADTLVPLGLWYIIAFSFGVVIGSFLNVFIYRFHTGKSLNGQSHCLSCGVELVWFDLFPLASYLVLRARCRRCGCRIPARYFLIELATGLLFMLALVETFEVVAIFILWYVLAVLLCIFVYDLYHFIIPDSLAVALGVGVGVWYGYQWWGGMVSLEQVMVSVGAAALGSAFFLALWLISKGQWIGFGDVKLALPLGLLVGAGGVFSFVVLSFWIGAIISLLLLTWQWLRRGQADLHLPSRALTMKSAVPFAPFLIASGLVVFFTQFNVLQLFNFLV